MDTITEDLNILCSDESQEFSISDIELSLKSNEEKHEISSGEYPYTLTLRKEDFDNDKDLTKFVNNCEKMVRMSGEYRIWTEYIREALGYHSCQITGELHNQTRVEIHHHPITLFSIVKGVVLRNIASKKQFCTFDVATEVIQLHYELKAPFCLLVKSLHDKYHNGYLEIPIDMVHGDYNYFINNYISFFEDDEASSIISKLSVNRQNCGWVNCNWVSSNVSS